MSDPAPTRLGESLKGLADSGLATVQTRLELFSVELKEEKLRAGSFLFDTVLAALFIGFGFVFLLAFLTVLFWDSHRLLALAVFTAVFLTLGAVALARAQRRLRGVRWFAASTAELARDLERLRGRG